MGIDIEIKGRYSGTGLLKRLSQPAAFLQRVQKWIAARERSDVLISVTGVGEGGAPSLGVQLHPAAQNIVLASPTPGELLVSARTNSVGPGYHKHICNLLHDMEREFGVMWTVGPGDDETDYFLTGNFEALEQSMRQWLYALCESIIEYPESDLAVCMPVDCYFQVGATITTMLGPRSRDWVASVIDGDDDGGFFPWPHMEKDGIYYLNRALCHMWTDVRWRKPITDDERKIQDSVVCDLDRAMDSDHDLAFPWREWRDLLGWSEMKSQHERVVSERAASAKPDSLIGYRRGTVVCRRQPGWAISVPGDMAEEEGEDGTWVGFTEGRSIHFSTYTSSDDDSKPVHAETLLAGGAAALDHWGGDRISEKDGEILRSARVFQQKDDDGDHWILVGLIATDGVFGRLTITFENRSDREWAEEVWRSARPNPPEQPDE